MNAPVPADTLSVAPVFISKTRAQVFEGLARKLPINELGLPKFLYRCDMIPNDFESLSQADQNQTLSAATIAITFREGYPTFYDGTPIWEQMETEDDDAFAFFNVYRQLHESYGIRQLSVMPKEVGATWPALATASRGDELALLAKIQEMAALHFWLYRAKAFDLFQVAMHRKRKETRLMQIENVHYLEADKLLKALFAALPNVMSEEKMGEMDPLDFIKAIKEATNIQRVALGVGEKSGRPSKNANDDTPANASMEVTLRTIARASQAGDTQDTTGSNAKVLDVLRGASPETLEAMQEVVMSFSMGGRTNKGLSISDKAAAKDEREDLAMITGGDDE